MNCADCGQPIEVERLNLGFSRCKGCAFDRPVDRVRGAMVYGHKTAGSVNVMSPEAWSYYRKISRRVGQRSALRNVLHAGGRSV